MPIESLSLSIGAAELPLTIATPARPGPLLAVVPSIFGVGPDVLAFAERFSAVGALVAVFNPMWRQGHAALDVDTESAQALARMRQHHSDDTLTDLRAVLDWADSHPLCTGARVALGICFGGRFAFQAAANGWVDAAATWHGGGLGALCGLAPQVKVPLRMDFGAVDPLIPPSEVARIQAAFADHRNATVAVHPDSGHGFTHVGTRAGNPAAAQAAAMALEGLLRQRMSAA